MAPTITQEELGRVRRRLMSQARLFEDPMAYAAGVEDTLDAVRLLLRGGSPDEGRVRLPESSGASRMM
jgi:hypothetical protein